MTDTTNTNASDTTTGNQPSTLKSYVDSAAGAVQSAIGAVTGRPADQNEAERTKARASAENADSHDVAKVGPFAASSSGAAAVDDRDRREGSWNQTVGSAKEAVGGLVGSQSLKQQGARQNEEGKKQEAQGQLSDYGSGIADRARGAVGNAASALAGDRDEQARYQEMHDRGKTQQRSAELDIQKQAGT
ncbi:MAG: hypothetical protein M1839_001824 [Geoglossum umbratile]|nr:MAG: hypothetical protein M1839_001824 [Geoglossum umbratile]